MNQLMARMAEMVVSHREGDVLVGLGLGSCIGMALVEGSHRAAGLAHIVLPASTEASLAAAAVAAKFADTAVPALLSELMQLGVRRHTLSAVIVGGAQMFALGGGMDIGQRNEAAVRAALAKAGIPILASVTGGSVGRTIRVYVGEPCVSYKEAGGPEINLLSSTTTVAA